MLLLLVELRLEVEELDWLDRDDVLEELRLLVELLLSLDRELVLLDD